MNFSILKRIFAGKAARCAIDLVVAFLILAILWARIERTPFHIDEAAWIGYSFYYHLFIENGDTSSPDWQSYSGRCDFPVAKYIYGAGLTLQGRPIRDLQVYETFGRLWHKPQELLDSLSVDLLFAARTVACVFSALFLWLVYLMTRRAAGTAAGIAASALLILNPISVVFTQALADPMLLACFAGGGLLLSAWRCGPEQLSGKRLWTVAIGAGILTGLAAAIKANGAIIGVYLALAAVWMVVRKRSRPRNRAAMPVTLAIAGIAALLAFIAVNPTLYQHPFQGIRSFLEFRAETIASQQAQIGPAIYGSLHKILIVAKRVLVAGPYVPFRCIGMLSLVGFALLVFRAIKKPRGSETLLIIWCGVMYCSTTAWIPLDWERYYLPPATAASVLAGVAIGIGFEVGFIKLIGLLRKPSDDPKAQKTCC